MDKSNKDIMLQAVKLIEEIEQAKEDFYYFCKVMFRAWTGEEIVDSQFLRDLTQGLNIFLESLISGKRPKEVKSAPPQHGKSTIDTRLFTAFVLYKIPKAKILITSYSSDMAEEFIQDIFQIMSTLIYQKEFLPDWEKRATVRVDRIITSYGGRVFGIGIEGSITGRGFDLLIIDDPHKTIPSRAEKKKAIKQYNSVLSTRMSKNSGQLLMMTRWAVDDLAGYLLGIDNVKSKWKYKAYKAINDNGEALIPELKDLDFLLDQKSTLSPSEWSAMYQQSPVIEGGNLIRTDNFNYYDPLDPPQELIMAQMSFIICDTAIGQKESNDNTVMAYFRKAGNNLYIPDLIKGKWSMLQQLEHMKNFRNKHNENVLKIERVGAHASNGLFELLAKEGIPAIPITPKGRDKVARVRQATPFIDRGQIYLPLNAPWLSDFLIECEQFTVDDSHPHDDQVDVLSYGIEEAFPIVQAGDPLTMSFNYKKL